MHSDRKHSIYRLSHLDGVSFYFCLRCGVWVSDDKWPGTFRGSCERNLENSQGHEFGEIREKSSLEVVVNGQVLIAGKVPRIRGKIQTLKSWTICCTKCRETALELEVEGLRWTSATRGDWEHSCRKLVMYKVLG